MRTTTFRIKSGAELMFTQPSLYLHPFVQVSSEHFLWTSNELSESDDVVCGLCCIFPTCDLVQSPVDEPVVLNDEVIFPLTVSLDKLPVSTLKVKVRAAYC